jgi:hypothetical protein
MTTPAPMSTRICVPHARCAGHAPAQNR